MQWYRMMRMRRIGTDKIDLRYRRFLASSSIISVWIA